MGAGGCECTATRRRGYDAGMSVSFNIPKPFEDVLRAEWGDLDLAAKDALVIESYRTGKLSIGQVADLLGLATRLMAEKWLGERGVAMNYGLDDLEDDRNALDEFFGRQA
jgi:predicted HTH domain antitoxin